MCRTTQRQYPEEADNGQVAQLINHPGIKRVIQVNAPGSAEEPASSPEKREDTVKRSLIFPQDPTNKAQLNDIAEFIKQLAADKELFEHSH